MFVITHATNADGALRAQSDCVAGGSQPEADTMNSETRRQSTLPEDSFKKAIGQDRV